jgi:ABC-type sugar transport system permease subunit
MSPMAELTLSPDRLDRLDRFAIGLSGLCMAHCLASSVLLAVFSAASGLLHPAFHEIGLMLAILLGAIALGRGIVRHGYMLPAAVGAFGLGMMAGALNLPHDGSGAETLWTLVGVAVLALGHDLNRRATY